MKAMIFAAGLGTRLRPLTDKLPKALVPVDGRPLLWHVIDKLKSAGYDDIVVNVHHFADMIGEYVRNNDLGVGISISDESGELLETGGGILHARHFLEGCGRFLAHNVDILSDLDMGWFADRVGEHPESMASLLVSRRETSRYLLFDDSCRLVGWTNVKTGQVRSPFHDIDLSSCRRYAFSGIHSISSDIFPVMDRYGFEGSFSIIDFYLKAAADYPIYGIVSDDLRMMDVGKAETLESAGDFLRSLR